jgi:transcription elongation factor GreA
MSNDILEDIMIAELNARLCRELDHLIDELTVIIPARLGTDQQYGDYQDTIVLQRLIQARIQDLRKLIAGLALVETDTLPQDAAGFGSVLRVRDRDTAENFKYTLLAGDGIDAEAGEVPLDSPIGVALVGCRAGDPVEVAFARGPLRLRVLSVATLFERLGTDPTVSPAMRLV